MKPLDKNKNCFYIISQSVLLVLFIFFTFVCSSCLLHIAEAAIPKQEVDIDYRSKKVSVVLKDVNARNVLEEIALKTNIEFVGLNNVTNVIDELEFQNLPLENAIKVIAQDSVIIFRKEGPEDGEKDIKKVIILVQKEKEEPPVLPVTPPPPKIEKEKIEKVEIKEPPKPVRPTPAPAPPPKREPPKIKPTPKPAPKPAIVSPPKKCLEDCLQKGQKYYDAKRWDLAAKNFRCYLENNPEDQEVKLKIAKAKQYAQEAISLYKSGRKAEDACNLKEALEIYKKSYALYPLLYDTWERIQALKKHCKCE